jgi:hypothetical protein
VCENEKSKLLVVPGPLVMVTDNNDDGCRAELEGGLRGLKIKALSSAWTTGDGDRQ